MSAPQELTVKEAAWIGMLGGLSLALLKLMQAQFYVDDPWSREARVAYFTYFVFIVLAGISGVFFSEHNVRRNTFVAGLLAPSILLTFFAAPNFRVATIGEPASAIRELSFDVIGTAYAQQPPAMGTPARPEKLDAKVQVIRNSDLQPGYLESFWRAIGKPPAPGKYLVVVGRTGDLGKAFATANSLNGLKMSLSAAEAAKLPRAEVVKFEGLNEYYVTLGALQSPIDAASTRRLAASVGVTSLAGDAAAGAQTVAPLLVDGVVIEARALARSEARGTVH